MIIIVFRYFNRLTTLSRVLPTSLRLELQPRLGTMRVKYPIFQSFGLSLRKAIGSFRTPGLQILKIKLAGFLLEMEKVLMKI